MKSMLVKFTYYFDDKKNYFKNLNHFKYFFDKMKIKSREAKT